MCKVELVSAHISDAFRGVSDKPSPIANARGCDVLSVSLILLESPPALQSINKKITHL